MKSCEEMYNEVQPLIEIGNQEEAIRAMEKLLQAYPEFAQGHHDLGALYFDRGDKKAAFEHYQGAVNLAPHDAAYIKCLGDYYYAELGDTDEAMKLYHQVLEVNPNEVETLLILGNLAVVGNNFDTAKNFYQRVLDIEPWNHDALTLFEKLDQRKLQDGNAQSPEATYQYSQELVQAGDIDGAIKELENLLAVQPDYALAHNDLGVLYFQNGLKDKTLVSYEEAVRMEPDNLNFQKNLADFYCVELGRIEDALEIYLKILTEEPTDIETLMAAGYICQAINKNNDAKVFFERVLDIEPWNLEANEILDQLSPAQMENTDISFKSL